MVRIVAIGTFGILLHGLLLAGPWKRHTVDASSRGADGVRLADANHDGLLDIATGWEEGGKVRAYLNPGPGKVREPWPAVTAGNVPFPRRRRVRRPQPRWSGRCGQRDRRREQDALRALAPPENYLDPKGWRTEALPGSAGMTQWMYVLPMANARTGKVDLVAGSKNDAAAVGVWASPGGGKPTWRRWYDAGWIMSLIARDVDGDGDSDVLATDRKGAARGALWFENTGVAGRWKTHRIGAVNERQIMFLDSADLDGDGLEDALAAVREGPILFFRRLPGNGVRWETMKSTCPPGTARARPSPQATSTSTASSIWSSPAKTLTGNCRASDC